MKLCMTNLQTVVTHLKLVYCNLETICVESLYSLTLCHVSTRSDETFRRSYPKKKPKSVKVDKIVITLSNFVYCNLETICTVHQVSS